MNLVEGKHHTGAIPHSKFRTLWKRATRKKAGAGIPYNWVEKTLSPKYAIKNQGQSESCGGQAKSRAEEILKNNAGVSTPEQSAKAIYSLIYLSGAGGTTLSRLEQDNGSANESVVPSSIPNFDVTEQFMEDTSWKNTQTLSQMALNAGYTPVTVNIEIESMAQAIRDYGAIIWIIAIENGLNPGWLSPMPTPPQNKNNLTGYHFMCSYAPVAITPTEFQGLKDGIITWTDLQQKYGF